MISAQAIGTPASSWHRQLRSYWQGIKVTRLLYLMVLWVILYFGNAFFSHLGLVLFILRVPEARGVLFGILRRDTDNQVKINRQLSGLRSFQGLEFLDEHVF